MWAEIGEPADSEMREIHPTFAEECEDFDPQNSSSVGAGCPPLSSSVSRYSPANVLKAGDEFVWKKTDLAGRGLTYYVVTHVVKGVAYAYQLHRPEKVLPIDMTEEVYVFPGRNHLGQNDPVEGPAGSATLNANQPT